MTVWLVAPPNPFNEYDAYLYEAESEEQALGLYRDDQAWYGESTEHSSVRELTPELMDQLGIDDELMSFVEVVIGIEEDGRPVFKSLSATKVA